MNLHEKLQQSEATERELWAKLKAFEEQIQPVLDEQKNKQSEWWAAKKRVDSLRLVIQETKDL